MLIHPSSGACDLFVELSHGLYCSGSMCVGVTLWFGCGGVVSVYSTNNSQAPEDGCINTRNILSIKYKNNKASDIKLVSLYSKKYIFLWFFFFKLEVFKQKPL